MECRGYLKHLLSKKHLAVVGRELDKAGGGGGGASGAGEAPGAPPAPRAMRRGGNPLVAMPVPLPPPQQQQPAAAAGVSARGGVLAAALLPRQGLVAQLLGLAPTAAPTPAAGGSEAAATAAAPAPAAARPSEGAAPEAGAAAEEEGPPVAEDERVAQARPELTRLLARAVAKVTADQAASGSVEGAEPEPAFGPPAAAAGAALHPPELAMPQQAVATPEPAVQQLAVVMVAESEAVAAQQATAAAVTAQAPAAQAAARAAAAALEAAAEPVLGAAELAGQGVGEGAAEDFWPLEGLPLGEKRAAPGPAGGPSSPQKRARVERGAARAGQQGPGETGLYRAGRPGPQQQPHQPSSAARPQQQQQAPPPSPVPLPPGLGSPPGNSMPAQHTQQAAQRGSNGVSRRDPRLQAQAGRGGRGLGMGWSEPGRGSWRESAALRGGTGEPGPARGGRSRGGYLPQGGREGPAGGQGRFQPEHSMDGRGPVVQEYERQQAWLERPPAAGREGQGTGHMAREAAQHAQHAMQPPPAQQQPPTMHPLPAQQQRPTMHPLPAQHAQPAMHLLPAQQAQPDMHPLPAQQAQQPAMHPPPAHPLQLHAVPAPTPPFPGAYPQQQGAPNNLPPVLPVPGGGVVQPVWLAAGAPGIPSNPPCFPGGMGGGLAAGPGAPAGPAQLPAHPQQEQQQQWVHSAPGVQQAAGSPFAVPGGGGGPHQHYPPVHRLAHTPHQPQLSGPPQHAQHAQQAPWAGGQQPLHSPPGSQWGQAAHFGQPPAALGVPSGQGPAPGGYAVVGSPAQQAYPGQQYVPQAQPAPMQQPQAAAPWPGAGQGQEASLTWQYSKLAPTSRPGPQARRE